MSASDDVAGEARAGLAKSLIGKAEESVGRTRAAAAGRDAERAAAAQEALDTFEASTDAVMAKANIDDQAAAARAREAAARLDAQTS